MTAVFRFAQMFPWEQRCRRLDDFPNGRKPLFAGLLALGLYAGSATGSGTVLFRDDYSDNNTFNTNVADNSSLSGTLVEPGYGMVPTAPTYFGDVGVTVNSGTVTVAHQGRAFVNHDFHNSSITDTGAFRVTLENFTPPTGTDWGGLGVFYDTYIPSAGALVVQPNNGLGLILRRNGKMTVWSKGASVAIINNVPANNVTLSIAVSNIVVHDTTGSFAASVLVNGTTYWSGTVNNFNTTRNYTWMQSWDESLAGSTTFGAWEVTTPPRGTVILFR